MLFRLLHTAAGAQSTGGVWYDGKWSSYASVAEDALRIAAVFRRYGVAPGDSVAIMLGSEPRFIATYFACAAMGAVAMPLNPKYARAELALLLGGVGPKLLVTGAAWVDKCRTALATAAPAAQVLAIADAADAPSLDRELRETAPITPVTCAPTDDAVILHSSGSTGRSKLIRRTHGQVMAEVAGFAAVAPTDGDDVFFATAPLFHAYGFAVSMLAAIRAQARLVLAPEGMSAILGRDTFAELIATHRVTVLPAVPLTLELLTHATREVDFSRLRLCISAGTGLPETTFQAFLQRFAVPIRQLYGCSEGGALTVNLDPDPDVRASWGSVGRGLPAVRLRIDEPDEEGVGPIAVSAPSLITGYAGLPEVNATSFADGWFRIGDRGRLDDRGNLYITGKRAFYIEVAGHKVDPYEIEDVLLTHPRVREAAVLGVPGRWGTRIKAVVVAADPAPESAELRRYCSEQLADYKVPHEVEFSAALPRSPLGKVLKKYLL